MFSQYYQLGILLLAVGAIAVRYDRRLTRIELLLQNHLAHHEGFEDKLSKLLAALVTKDKI